MARRPRYQPALSIVTGASSGIGAAFARALAARGSDLVLVARREDRLLALARELEQPHGIRCTVAPLDLSRPGAGAALLAVLDSRLDGRVPDLLVNNAGFGVQGRVADTDPARLAEEVAVDVAAVVELSRTFVAPMIARGSGAILNIASTAAYQPVPGMAVYAASKSFVKLFTEALWFEARPHGVTVFAVAPGAVASEFFDRGRRIPAPTPYWDPARIADAGLRALDRRRTPPEVMPGLANRAAAFSTRFIPRRVLLFFAARLTATLLAVL
ncbi:SDR family NAD(P)-dependent oxidoreductase [Lysinimonas soli]|uniref:SDR family NAD(P)-dependent oxidoreductase n=1 Tax=Lysinimonas soli TaxID=1074233 RepID=A0ABW0NMB5_9MICO